MHNLFKSALAVAKEGKSKAEQLQLLTNSWELTSDQVKELELSAYFLLQWEGKYLHSQISNGIIYDGEDAEYCVIYRSCTPANVFKHPQVRCSFRASPVGNFVLVQPVYK